MTLYEAYNIIKSIAEEQPNVHSVVKEFTDLNREDASYTAVVIQQREHSRDEDFIIYNFYLGYVDRINEMKDNQLQIQSDGIDCLENIIHTVNKRFEGIDIASGQFIVFNQRFTAECAGVYTDISVSVPISDCGTDYTIWENQDSKSVYIPAGTFYTRIIPDDGYAGMKEVIVTSDTLQDKKTVSIGVNGTYTVTPDDAPAVREVELNVRVPLKVDLSTGAKFARSSFRQLPFDIWVSDPSTLTDVLGMFENCYSLETIPWFDTSGVVQANSMCWNCDNLRGELPAFDFSNTKYINGAFLGAGFITGVPKWNFSNVEDAGHIFSYCWEITDLGGFTGLKVDLDLSGSTKLTHDSILNVINEAADVTAYPKTLTLGSTNLAKLSDEEKGIATSKGWILA